MKASSEPVTGNGVADRKREEAEPYGQHDEVQHLDAPWAVNAVQPGMVRYADARQATARRDKIKNTKSDCPDFAAEVPPCLLRYCREDMPFAA